MEVIYNCCVKDLDQTIKIHFDNKIKANTAVFVKLVYSDNYNKQGLFKSDIIHNPCLYCNKVDAYYKQTIDLPSYPYYGYCYPKMSYHSSCLNNLVNQVQSYILYHGNFLYKKRYHKLLLLSKFLIQDIIHYIGFFMVNL